MTLLKINNSIIYNWRSWFQRNFKTSIITELDSIFPSNFSTKNPAAVLFLELTQVFLLNAFPSNEAPSRLPSWISRFSKIF